MKIVLDRPIEGYTEIATDPTRERTFGIVDFVGWHGPVLFGEGKRPLRVSRIEFDGYRVSIAVRRRGFGHGLTFEDAIESALSKESTDATGLQ